MSKPPQGPPTDSASDLAAAAEREEARARERQLIRRAQRGEEAAFAELYQLFEHRAWRVARNLLPSDEDASDLLQEAFLRVFKHLDRFDFQYAFSTWLYRIVTNLSIDFLRKRRPTYSTQSPLEEEGEFELEDEKAEAPSLGMERGETRDEVRACLDALAPHFRSVLILRELEGLPCAEIAEIVGTTHVTVRWRLHRGRKLFQEEWLRRERSEGIQFETNSAETGAEREEPPETEADES